MMDIFSPNKRSEVMGKIASKNTKPEIIVRKLLFSMGYRYRLHRKDLPGKPDIVLPKYGTAIFVNGCFWHGHWCKKGRSYPKQNGDFWRKKLNRNKQRDKSNYTALAGLGWKVLVIWECEIKNAEKLRQILLRALQD